MCTPPTPLSSHRPGSGSGGRSAETRGCPCYCTARTTAHMLRTQTNATPLNMTIQSNGPPGLGVWGRGFGSGLPLCLVWTITPPAVCAKYNRAIRAVLQRKKRCPLQTISKKGPGWWQLAVGSWRLVAVGAGWWLVISGWWQLAVVGGWWLAGAGGWRLVAVGGWWQLAVGGSWQLAVGGLWGRSSRAVLRRKKRGGVLKDHPACVRWSAPTVMAKQQTTAVGTTVALSWGRGYSTNTQHHPFQGATYDMEASVRPAGRWGWRIGWGPLSLCERGMQSLSAVVQGEAC